MKLTIIQPDIVWADPQANVAHLDQLLATCAPTDLLVLPEMFTTGFATGPEGIAEPECSVGLQWMKSTASARGCAVAGSIATKVGDTYRNRFYFVKPDGSVEYYDKHHLFTYSGEHNVFTAGQERVIVEWQGVRILLQVCYDLRFPVFVRNRLASDGRAEYDLALYVASWPESRAFAWETLLRARAIENQCYVAGVNRVGTDAGNVYNGLSRVYGPKGETVADTLPGTESAAVAELDLPALEAFRNAFPVLADADL